MSWSQLVPSWLQLSFTTRRVQVQTWCEQHSPHPNTFISRFHWLSFKFLLVSEPFFTCFFFWPWKVCDHVSSAAAQHHFLSDLFQNHFPVDDSTVQKKPCSCWCFPGAWHQTLWLKSILCGRELHFQGSSRSVCGAFSKVWNLRAPECRDAPGASFYRIIFSRTWNLK